MMIFVVGVPDILITEFWDCVGPAPGVALNPAGDVNVILDDETLIV